MNFKETLAIFRSERVRRKPYVQSNQQSGLATKQALLAYFDQGEKKQFFRMWESILS